MRVTGSVSGQFRILCGNEAIAEFQKALRATEGRLKSSEALGMCFFEKGQFSVAETILRRLGARGGA